MNKNKNYKNSVFYEYLDNFQPINFYWFLDGFQLIELIDRGIKKE